MRWHAVFFLGLFACAPVVPERTRWHSGSDFSFKSIALDTAIPRKYRARRVKSHPDRPAVSPSHTDRPRPPRSIDFALGTGKPSRWETKGRLRTRGACGRSDICARPRPATNVSSPRLCWIWMEIAPVGERGRGVARGWRQSRARDPAEWKRASEAERVARRAARRRAGLANRALARTRRPAPSGFDTARRRCSIAARWRAPPSRSPGRLVGASDARDGAPARGRRRGGVRRRV